MKFYVFEDGCPEDEQTIEIAPGTRNPRAKAAAMFCASRKLDGNDRSAVPVAASPATRSAAATVALGKPMRSDRSAASSERSAAGPGSIAGAYAATVNATESPAVRKKRRNGDAAIR